MGGGPDINYPQQPTYGEGMADALKAQVELLTGRGDFAEIAPEGLQGLLPLEEEIRRQTAQTDTDILRQTLLGGETQMRVVRDPETGKFGIPGTSVATDADGNELSVEGRYQFIITDPGMRPTFNGKAGPNSYNVVMPTLRILDTETGGLGKSFGGMSQNDMTQERAASWYESTTKNMGENVSNEILNLNKSILNAGGDLNAPSQDFTFVNPYTGEALESGETITIRDESGLVDLLGDKRLVTDPTSGEMRQAGFSDTGKFLGLAALAEDIQRGNVSRQREADLMDVQRLAPKYKDIIDTLEDENLMNSIGEVGGSQDVFLTRLQERRSGETAPASTTATSADPLLTAAAGGGTGLREALTNDALAALQQGLTDREERQIAEAARARSTMMGRTFDQSGAIAEAEDRVAEDNQRRMQNRAFAQNVLGQEADTRFRELALQQANKTDPINLILGRASGGSLQQGQSVLGQAGYGLDSMPSYLNPEAGLGYISQRAANEANLYAANQAADATRTAGIFQGIGSAIGGFCWVAREVYGPTNPAWLQFREWMFTESPNWFFNLYKNYGERFAQWISDKPRIKSIIRKWMDSKIGDK